MAIDWSLARGGGNAFAAAMDGYQAGRALAKEKGVQNALATYAANPEAGSQELMRYDPQVAMQLDASRASQAREATTYAQGQEDRTRKLQEDRIRLAGQLLQGVTTPAQWDAVKGDPQIEALIPGIAASPFEKVAQLRQMGIALNAKAPEAVTLRQGEKHFGPSGDLIASVDPAPVRPVVVGQGAVALGADGSPVFKNPKTYAPPRPGSSGGGVPPLPPGFVIEK